MCSSTLSSRYIGRTQVPVGPGLGWVHRDVSVGNILLCEGKLADLEYGKKVGIRGVMKCGRQVNLPSNYCTGCVSTGYDALHVSRCAEVSISTPLYLTSTSIQPISCKMSEILPHWYTKTTTIPFSHNHLHDLGSLWWVMVFYTVSRKPRDRTMNCHSPKSFQISVLETYFDLPVVICGYLDNPRRNLLKHDAVIESTLPHSMPTTKMISTRPLERCSILKE